MQLNITHIFLLLFGFSTASQTNDNYLSSFTEITLQVCQQLSVKEKRAEEKLPNDVINTMKIFTNCIQQFWMKCIREQDMSVTVTKYTFSNRPCFASSLHLPDHNITFDIEIYRIFQIKLTFTTFNLKRSRSGCKFHNIKVSKSLLIDLQ